MRRVYIFLKKGTETTDAESCDVEKQVGRVIVWSGKWAGLRFVEFVKGDLSSPLFSSM